MYVGGNVYIRPAALGTSAGVSSTAGAADEEGFDLDDEYIDPKEEINKMRFTKYMSAFDIDLETLEVHPYVFDFTVLMH